jgi:IS5 family transposase
MCEQQTKQPRGFSMRETRIAQASIFENYSEHEFGARLKALSNLLDQHPEVLSLVAKDLVDESATKVGRTGLSAESIFRCLLLKQQLRISYEQLAFHLSDSMTYRTFARLPNHLAPSRSGLQSTIRSIKPETLERAHEVLSVNWLKEGVLSMDKLRIDSTVVASNIAPPIDSQLLNDGVRVLSRFLAKSKNLTGVKVRFTDQRKPSKSLAFQVFNAKKAEKEVLYPKLIKRVRIVLKQVDRGLESVNAGSGDSERKRKWIRDVERYRDLTLIVIDQTERRVVRKESVHSSEKVVSLFEPHTDIIVKGFRDVQYGHKINLSSEKNGFITHLSIEEGNPSDKELFIPVLDFHQSKLGRLPGSVVADGGYASQANVKKGRDLGVKQVVFQKPVGLSLHAMGVKKKTFDRLRHFRAGVEGNISELKRAFGLTKAKWKGHDGFKAYVWSSVLAYNLTRLARLDTG